MVKPKFIMKKNYILLTLFLLSFPILLTNLYAQQAGSLDTSFGADGKVATNISNGLDISNGVDIISSMALQADGKIIVAGASGAGTYTYKRIVARYNSDGSLDTSFGSGGRVFDNKSGGDAYLAVAVQSDGKIVAVGRREFSARRYNSDGSSDPTFGNEGRVKTEFTEYGYSNDEAFAVALQADGKIVIGGMIYRPGYSNTGNFALARYHANGGLDTSFNTSGKVVTDFDGLADGIQDLAIQPDGKILAAGFAERYGEQRNFAIARYNIDGSLDTSFGEDGKVSTNITGNHDTVRSLILLDNGKILVGGSTNPAGGRLGLARYNSDGSLDTSFGDGGKIGTINSPGTAIALQDDGKIVSAGLTSKSEQGKDFGIARFNPDGSVDLGFKDEGETNTDFAGGDDQIYALLLQPDGKILAAGSAEDAAHHHGATTFALARYHGGAGLGLENTKSLTSLNIYPNPSNGRFSIQTEAIISSVNITDILGQNVEKPLFYSEGQNYTIDLNNEQTGLYFLTLTTENGILTKKIIVQ